MFMSLLYSASLDVMGTTVELEIKVSVANQRIEAWWGILRRGCSDWWIRFFKDMRDSGLYCANDAVQAA